MIGQQFRYRNRRATASRWSLINPVLGDGELGLEKDTRAFKFGDGATPWNDLPYAGGGSYLPLTGKAVDSDKLDGYDSSEFAKFTDLPTVIAPYRREPSRTLTASGTIAVTDEGNLVSFNLVGAAVCTIPANATVPFPVGGWVDIQTISSAGPVTITPAVGVTIRNPVFGRNLVCVNTYAPVRLLKIGTDEWMPIAGRLDTGWVTIPSANGYTIGGDGANWRVVNGYCSFQIHVGASTAAAGATILTFPAGARPLWNHWWGASFANVYKGEVKLTTSTGALSFALANTAFVVSGGFHVG
jgi:hypothetical protein